MPLGVSLHKTALRPSGRAGTARLSLHGESLPPSKPRDDFFRRVNPPPRSEPADSPARPMSSDRYLPKPRPHPRHSSPPSPLATAAAASCGNGCGAAAARWRPQRGGGAPHGLSLRGHSRACSVARRALRTHEGRDEGRDEGRRYRTPHTRATGRRRRRQDTERARRQSRPIPPQAADYHRPLSSALPSFRLPRSLPGCRVPTRAHESGVRPFARTERGGAGRRPRPPAGPEIRSRARSGSPARLAARPPVREPEPEHRTAPDGPRPAGLEPQCCDMLNRVLWLQRLGSADPAHCSCCCLYCLLKRLCR